MEADEAHVVVGTAGSVTRPSHQRSLGIPRLENGDHLSREEFERRFDAMAIKKAELIDGMVLVGGPVSITALHTPPPSAGSAAINAVHRARVLPLAAT